MNNIGLKERKVKLVEEQKDLSLKVEKLHKFLQSEEFSITREMQNLLIEQYAYMKNYLRILNKRIALINEEIKKK